MKQSLGKWYRLFKTWGKIPEKFSVSSCSRLNIQGNMIVTVSSKHSLIKGNSAEYDWTRDLPWDSWVLESVTDEWRRGGGELGGVEGDIGKLNFPSSDLPQLSKSLEWTSHSLCVHSYPMCLLLFVTSCIWCVLEGQGEEHACGAHSLVSAFLTTLSPGAEEQGREVGFAITKKAWPRQVSSSLLSLCLFMYLEGFLWESMKTYTKFLEQVIFFITLVIEIHSLIRVPFRGWNDRGKGNFSKRGSRHSGELLSSNKLSTYTVSTN